MENKENIIDLTKEDTMTIPTSRYVELLRYQMLVEKLKELLNNDPEVQELSTQ